MMKMLKLEILFLRVALSSALLMMLSIFSFMFIKAYQSPDFGFMELMFIGPVLLLFSAMFVFLMVPLIIDIDK